MKPKRRFRLSRLVELEEEDEYTDVQEIIEELAVKTDNIASRAPDDYFNTVYFLIFEK